MSHTYTYPSAPWDAPPDRPRTPCVACGGTGVASNGKSCAACESQRAIDDAAARAGLSFATPVPTNGYTWADAWGSESGARIITDCSSSLYHSDPNGPSLSASMGTTVLNKSPYHGWLTHPKKGALRFEPTKPMNGGTLLHALVLGKGLDGVEVLDFGNFKTKAAQEARDAAVDAGKTPMLRREFEDAILVANDARESLADLGYPLTGISEAVVTWYEQSAYGPVKCRAMMDHLRLDLCAVWDFKTANSAHPRAIQSHISEYGYDVQESAYRSALRKLVPGSAGRESFTFLFCETMPPGSPRRALITPCRLSGMFRTIGENRWRRAIELWAKCNRDDLWPAYTEECIEIEPPTWVLRNEVAEGVAIEPAPQGAQ